MVKRPRDKWKVVTADQMRLDRYACGVTAGDTLKLRRDIVVRDHRGRETGVVHKVGEIWVVLAGNPIEPQIVWLRQPDGAEHTWDSADLFETFERLS